MVYVATTANAHPPPTTIPGLISRGLEPANVRAGPALQAFAQRFASEAALTYLNGPTSAGAAAGAFDSSQGLLGPIFLSTAATVGAGNTNVNVVGQYNRVEPSLDNPGLLLIKPETSLDEFAAQITYNLRLTIADVAIAVSHGITDNLDVSLLFLIVSADMNVAASGSIVRQQTNGGFKPVPRAPTKSGSRSLSAFGPGDTTLRFKYHLPQLGRFQIALNTEVQFPTGDAALLHGTGDYWITPTANIYTGWSRVDATLNLGMDFDISSPNKSQALYGLGSSVALIPGRLAGVVEFLGRSELDQIPTPGASGAFYLLPNGTVAKRPVFGFDLGRHDYFDLAFGFRVALGHGLLGFVNGVYAINKVGLHDHQVVPVVGIGATF